MLVSQPVGWLEQPASQGLMPICGTLLAVVILFHTQPHMEVQVWVHSPTKGPRICYWVVSEASCYVLLQDCAVWKKYT